MNTRVVEVETGLQIQLGCDRFERCLLGTEPWATHCHLPQRALRRETSHPWQMCPQQCSTLESTQSRACSCSNQVRAVTSDISTTITKLVNLRRCEGQLAKHSPKG